MCSVITAVTVPSKNCLRTAVCCAGCKIEFKKAVHRVTAQRPVRARSTCQDTHHFLLYMVCDSGDIIIMYLSSYFRTLILSAIS